jgi:hypothetical protein
MREINWGLIAVLTVSLSIWAVFILWLERVL